MAEAPDARTPRSVLVAMQAPFLHRTSGQGVENQSGVWYMACVVTQAAGAGTSVEQQQQHAAQQQTVATPQRNSISDCTGGSGDAVAVHNAPAAGLQTQQQQNQLQQLISAATSQAQAAGTGAFMICCAATCLDTCHCSLTTP